MKKIVIALGGNALQSKGKPANAEEQLKVIKESSKQLVEIIKQGYQIVIAHGNGPQVGRIVLQNEAANDITPAMPLDVCGAMSQGMIGYHLQQGLRELLLENGIDKLPVSLITQVLVDKNDPGFKNPTKPIGPFYTKEEAEKLEKEKGFSMKEDAQRGYRRVVASPKPVEIIEKPAIEGLIGLGHIVISVGGGGIPVIKNDEGKIEGIAAVIDKDLASERLAEDIDADILMILTEVEKVAVNYKKEDEFELGEISSDEIEGYLKQGQFPAGSMGPKVEAAITFARSKSGRRCIISSLEKALEAINGRTGTHVI